jgi:hypothetical protein
VCTDNDREARFDELLRDPLIRLVMASDRVTERDMIALKERIRRALAARAWNMAGQSPALAAPHP